MVITKSFNLDINTPWKAPTLYIKQGDVDSRKLQATIRRDGVNYTIPGDVFATFRMHKPDDTFVTQDCTISGSVVSVVMDAQCATAAGHGKAEFVLQTASEVVSTFNLAIEILPAAVTDGDIESRDALNEYRTILEEMLRVKGAPLTANTAADMTDTDRVYVYTGSEVGYVNGSWYYYDGDSWEVGGVYNSQAIADDFLAEITQMIKQSAVASESDSTPYLYRPTPNPSAILADEEIVGGTVAHNQIADNTLPPTDRNGMTFAGASDGFTVNGTASTYTGAAGWFGIGAGYWTGKTGHKVYVSYKLVSGTVGTPANTYFNVDDANSDAKVVLGETRIISISANPGRSIWSTMIGNVFTSAKVRVQATDLTAKFGSTIADYLYTLESATPGAGVAKLREWGFLSKEYFAYDAGSLVSVNTEGKRVVGVNQWDEQWELGTYNQTTGEKATGTTTIRSANKFPVFGGMSYYFKTGGSTMNMQWWDADGNYIGHNQRTDTTFTVPANACYCAFYMASAYGTTYKNDVCISIANAQSDGKYYPYKTTTYPTTPTDLNGIFYLDENNQLRTKGDVYHADGTIERRWNDADITSYSVSTTSTPHVFVFVLNATNTGNKRRKYGTNADGITGLMSGGYSFYGNGSSSNVYPGLANMQFGFLATTATVAIRNDSCTTAAEMETALNGLHIVYEIDDQDKYTETADPYPATQIAPKGGTEERIDNRAVPVPVGHRTTYYIGVPDVPAAGSDLVLKATVSGGKTTLKWS